MWRLLVVLALCGASLVQGEEHGVSCNNIPTLQNVPLTELKGSWVVRKSLSERTVAVKTSCLTYEISDTSESGMTVEMNSPSWHVEDKVHLELRVVGDNKGRLSNKSNKSEIGDEEIEILLVSTDTSSYLVSVICHKNPNNHEDTNDELSVLTVHFLARRQGRGDRGNLSEENLTKIFNETSETLGLQNYQKDLIFHTDC